MHWTELVQFNQLCCLLSWYGTGVRPCGCWKRICWIIWWNVVIRQKTKDRWLVQHFKEYYPRTVNGWTWPRKGSKSGHFGQFGWYQRTICSRMFRIIGVINYETAFRRDYRWNSKGSHWMLDESSLITNEIAITVKVQLWKMQPESVDFIIRNTNSTAGKYERLWSQVTLFGWNITKGVLVIIRSGLEWLEKGDGYKNEVITGTKQYGTPEKKTCRSRPHLYENWYGIEPPEQTEIEDISLRWHRHAAFYQNSYTHAW